MKKRWVALLTAVCLVAAPMSALAEETDYSYLEDMSIKELRALRDAINELLGETNETDNMEVTIELTNEEKLAVKAISALKDEVVDPSALSVNKLYYGHQNIELGSGAKFPNIDTIIIDFTASNARKYGTVNLRKRSGSSFVYGTFNDVNDETFEIDLSTWSSSPYGLIDYTEFEKEKKERILANVE